ncbi:MAG: tRNA (adenosine(37)-N6)-threonylcarbamoyltransferase complex dimerization subunit type 1 TsaB [Pyrinomonadaceae bacterium]
MNNVPTILAIESAIRGGSIALAHNAEIIDTWVGEGGVSRAEDLLWNIDLMLKRNGIEKRELSNIAVSAGPGSFTGIRIGLATAMGIAASLNISLARYSILYAMAVSQPDSELIITAVPVGRGVICKQSFQKNAGKITAATKPIAVAADQFEMEIQDATITAEDYDRGLAVCLIDAANDQRVPLADEPLFISKPAHL